MNWDFGGRPFVRILPRMKQNYLELQVMLRQDCGNVKCSEVPVRRAAIWSAIVLICVCWTKVAMAQSVQLPPDAASFAFPAQLSSAIPFDVDEGPADITPAGSETPVATARLNVPGRTAAVLVAR